ncbi:MAG: exosortase/archaeosortase family protein [Verrucomicrobia bacterium]|nr:exosortase/archaeosortase family protein [Verrucomicrobiota bacterium]MBT7068451.1 exosortase/archaeosortase family protein [Verrucomicrobiota bacterium]MBT7699131.1 exosortase/archaeosortase family protein [Verrucomicrobiota bacterium]
MTYRDPTEAVQPHTTRDLCLFILPLALVIILFHFWGNRSSVAMESPSLLRWIMAQWTHAGGDFSHGWIMPIISLGVIAMRRRELLAAPRRQNGYGMLLVIFCLALHWAALRAQQPRVSLVALATLLWAIPLYLYGWAFARWLLFPYGYLMLSFTSYLLVAFTFPLRLTASGLSTHILNGLGIAAIRHGTAIHSAAGGAFNFNVADPCSGLRSLAAMTALAAPFAYMTQRTALKRWTLFLLSVPLAMLANTARIVTIALVAEGFGQDKAMALYHDFSGYLVFVLATLLMIGAGATLNIDIADKIRQWKRNYTPDI